MRLQKILRTLQPPLWFTRSLPRLILPASAFLATSFCLFVFSPPPLHAGLACLIPLAGLGLTMAVVIRLSDPVPAGIKAAPQRLQPRARLGRMLHRMTGLRNPRVAAAEKLCLQAFRKARDAMFLADGEMRLLEVNDSFCELWGRRRADLLGRPLADVLAEARLDQEDFSALLIAADFRGDMTVTQADGALRIFDFIGMALSRDLYLGIAREVTEQRLYQEELQRAAEWRELILRHLDDGLLVIDAEGRPAIHNRMAETLLGLTAEDFTRLSLREGELRLAGQRWVLRPADGHGDPLQLVLQQAGRVQDRRMQVWREGRQERELAINLAPLFDAHQQLIGALATLREVNSALPATGPQNPAARMTELMELAASAGHEIINRMTGIISYAQLLHERMPAETEEAGLLRGVIAEGERITGILRHLLGFARLRPQERLVTPLEGVIAAALSLMQPRLAKDGIRVKSTAAPHLPPVSCHCQQIQEVFVNLLSNAQYALNLKYAGGHPEKVILIHTTLVSRPDGGRRLRTTVMDTGIGIAPENLHRVFAPFFSTKPKDQGTGLGLSLSRQIVREHGGEIYVESELGGYALFIVELPAAEEPARET
ncbi:MAG: ATP-binding protein [candidate division KSB1 bacterium]|nr:ATP-binding protein [candidate division KSB1 bacterium]MDZ7276398.1 ATP-binding protein [candidate division KSB1 bacterium]MDZ7288069.1 ATP-binding protein [candidate division KSB1 bacterium]MDZ7300169.1 ATP-binding protein [candidate division KSB1 bacterium]MDZ7308827.1 ATP-binding protein [candidate division KSB1 bacterium]